MCSTSVDLRFFLKKIFRKCVPENRRLELGNKIHFQCLLRLIRQYVCIEHRWQFYIARVSICTRDKVRNINPNKTTDISKRYTRSDGTQKYYFQHILRGWWLVMIENLCLHHIYQLPQNSKSVWLKTKHTPGCINIITYVEGNMESTTQTKSES